MVCADCRAENPASAQFCSGCGARLFRPGSGSPTAEAGTASGGLRGVRGWLLFYCIVTTILAPFFFVAQAASSGDTVVWLIHLVFAGLAIATGVSLWAVRRSALRLVKVFFISMLCVALLPLIGSLIASLSHQGLTRATGVSPADDGLTSAGQTFGYVATWWLYFSKSKRVKATYGANL